MWFFCYLLYEIKAFYAKNEFVLFIVILFRCNSCDKNGAEKRDTHLAVLMNYRLQTKLIFVCYVRERIP